MQLAAGKSPQQSKALHRVSKSELGLSWIKTILFWLPSRPFLPFFLATQKPHHKPRLTSDTAWDSVPSLFAKMAHNSYPRRSRRRREPHIGLIDALFLPELSSPPRYREHSVRVVARDKDGRRHEYSACSASPKTNKSRSSSSSTTSKSSRYKPRQDQSPPRNTSRVLEDLKTKAAALFKSQPANQEQDSPRSSRRHDSPRSEIRGQTPQSHESLRDFPESKRHTKPSLKASPPRDSALPETVSPLPRFTKESISTHSPAQTPSLRQLFVAGTSPAARSIQYLQQALDHKEALLKLHPSNEGLQTAVTSLKSRLNGVLDSVASTQSHVWTSPPQAPSQACAPQRQVVSPLPSPQSIPTSPPVKDETVRKGPVVLSDELDRLTIRHHLCSVCGNIRSPEFHKTYPFSQPVQNICTDCRDNGAQSEIPKDRHFCCGCGIVRSKQYQQQHPMLATKPNYCNDCKTSARAFPNIMDTSVVSQVSNNILDYDDSYLTNGSRTPHVHSQGTTGRSTRPPTSRMPVRATFHLQYLCSALLSPVLRNLAALHRLPESKLILTSPLL